MLSMGGKEIVVKSILQALPVYDMHCFLFPRKLCRSLEGMISAFWWQNSSNGEGYPLVLLALVVSTKT